MSASSSRSGRTGWTCGPRAGGRSGETSGVPGLRGALQAPRARRTSATCSSGTASPIAARRSRPTACSRATASPLPRRAGRPVRALRHVARCRCCAFLSRTTSSSRRDASARSAPTWRTGSSTRTLYRAVAGSRGAHPGARPGGVDVEPLDDGDAASRPAPARRAVRPAAVLRRGPRPTRCSHRSSSGCAAFVRRCSRIRSRR